MMAWDAAVLLVVGCVEVAWAPNDICRVFFGPDVTCLRLVAEL
jgi:hypothetical protein